MNPLSIVAFTGPAGSGKDTAGRILIEQYGFTRLAFAQPLKAMLAAMGYPEPATQDEKEKLIPELGVSWRYLAQTLGTEWGRETINPDIWTIVAEQKVRRECGRWVITDLRFENEAALVRSLNGIVCHLEGRSHAMSEDTKTHASEAGIMMNAHDIIIDNSPMIEIKTASENVKWSTDKLQSQIVSALRYVGIEK